MTKRRKRLCHEFHHGLCGVCGEPVPMYGGTIYDHRIPLHDGGDDDEGPNLRPLCPACDCVKTSNDLRAIGKTRRRIKRDQGTRRPRKKIPSPGFAKGKRKMASRPFPKKKEPPA